MKPGKEQVMVAKGMQDHGTSVRQLARQFRVMEGAVRYRLRKLEEEEIKSKGESDKLEARHQMRSEHYRWLRARDL